MKNSQRVASGLHAIEEWHKPMMTNHCPPPGSRHKQDDQANHHRIDKSRSRTREHDPHKNRRDKRMHSRLRVTHHCQPTQKTGQKNIRTAIFLLKPYDCRKGQQHEELTRATSETTTHDEP